MNHKLPREVKLGTPDRPIIVYIFSEGDRGWLEKTVETPYRGIPATHVGE